MVDYSPPRTVDQLVRRGQDALRSALDRGQLPWEKGMLVENVRLSSAEPTSVPHRLRRAPRGFIVVGARTIGDIVPTEGISVVALSYGQQTASMKLCYGGGDVTELSVSFWFW